MSILIDQNEPEEFDFLLTRMGLETTRGSYNKTNETGAVFPDFVVLTTSGMLGVNRKQATEAMADLDKVEAQLMSELAACERLVFMWEGFMSPHEDGTYAGDLRTITHKTGRGGNEYDELTSRGRVIHQPYVRWEAFVYKCQDAGIPVVGTGDVRGSAGFLAHLHQGHGNNLFSRLIATRQQVAEIDPEKRAFALSTMGLQGARWGEELGLSVADFLVGHEMPPTLASVMKIGDSNLAAIPLRSGKRVVGKAAAQRLFAALGY